MCQWPFLPVGEVYLFHIIIGYSSHSALLYILDIIITHCFIMLYSIHFFIFSYSRYNYNNKNIVYSYIWIDGIQCLSYGTKEKKEKCEFCITIHQRIMFVKLM